MQNLNTELSLDEYKRRTAILDFMPVGILVLDKCGTIKSLSPQVSIILGLDGRQITDISHCFFDFIAQTERAEFIHFFESVSSSDQNILGLLSTIDIPSKLSLDVAISLRLWPSQEGSPAAISACILPVSHR
ncbi:MAG: hypothetical protein SFV17_20090 [Candidatus Obscuribacter sp.]|nr:hypothetical protein [Candidatus Obscuribacter sp.]